MTTTFVVPDNPGTRITFVGETTLRPPSSIADTVAVLFTHDWGPLNAPQRLTSFGDWEPLYSTSDSDGKDAVLGAFVGNGMQVGLAAAGNVIAMRIGTSSAAKAAHNFTNTTPATALTLTALYEGTRGDDLTVTIDSDPNDAAKDRLRVLLDGVTVEKYSYTKTNITALAAAINARPSRYVSAAAPISGVALTHVSNTALTGGNDGSSVTTTEYQTGLDALEFEDFSVLTVANLADESIFAQIVSWLDAQEEEQRPLEAVIGGDTDEALADAITAVASLRDIHLVRLAAGNVHDDFLDKDISMAQLAPRVAGALAGAGEERALTFMPLAGVTLLDPIEVPTDALRTASDAGLTALRRASVPGADVIVNRGVTTFNDQDDLVRPYAIFSDPRLVRVLDLFLRRVKTRGDAETIGLPNSEETRTHVNEIGRAEIARLAADNLIVNTAEDAPFFNALEPTDDAPDLIPFEFGWRFNYTTNYLVGVGRIR